MNDRRVSPENTGLGEPDGEDRDAIPARPTFIYRSSVHADELDSLGLLHGARFLVQVERAIVSFCRTLGAPWGVPVDENPDQFQMVSEAQARFSAPFRGVGEMVIHIWVERLGESSCIYGFLCASVEGTVVYARGRRTVVKLDPATLEPASWSELFTRGHLPLL
jgi:acyl-CoA thioester hydrolase